jgi:hypothetical protein
MVAKTLLVGPERRPRCRAEARVARAKVSAIPTTLGGKLPPVSILSRREYGLRA